MLSIILYKHGRYSLHCCGKGKTNNRQQQQQVMNCNFKILVKFYNLVLFYNQELFYTQKYISFYTKILKRINTRIFGYRLYFKLYKVNINIIFKI